jgi:histone deacetylase 1/2
MLIHSAAPLEFWAEALAMATYLVNRRPCRATGTTTPYELLFGTPPSYGKLRVFGCRCFPNTVATSNHKLDARSTISVFIGYPADHRGYRCYNLTTGRVITSGHVVFDEAVFPFRDAPLPPVDPPRGATPQRTRRDAGTVTIATSTFG